MTKPLFVTFTGVDRKTDLTEMLELSLKYPIEWGVLHSKNPKSNRYPTPDERKSIERLGFQSEVPVMLSAHLCGQVSKRFQTTSGFNPIEYMPYSRIQVNSVSYNIDVLTQHAQSYTSSGPSIILQHRKGNFPQNNNFNYLLDRSGGRGAEETAFPVQKYPYLFCGYAGGISPDNVENILERVDARNYWIDMESGIRTDDWFDLEKCRTVCEKIWGK